VTVITADADAEADAAGRHFCEICELSSYGDRVSQRQQVDADIYAQSRVQVGDTCCYDHAIVAVSYSETDMVCKEDVVNSGVGH
jgi:uncharacterized protein YijF (DUF1287 family)